jgi:hypothetical protein
MAHLQVYMKFALRSDVSYICSDKKNTPNRVKISHCHLATLSCPPSRTLEKLVAQQLAPAVHSRTFLFIAHTHTHTFCCIDFLAIELLYSHRRRRLNLFIMFGWPVIAPHFFFFFFLSNRWPFPILFVDSRRWLYTCYALSKAIAAWWRIGQRPYKNTRQHVWRMRLWFCYSSWLFSWVAYTFSLTNLPV